MRRLVRTLVIAVFSVPPVVALLVGAAYLVDRAVTDAEVARNVTLEGRPIGGLGAADLERAIDGIGADRLGKQVELRLPGLTISAAAGELGLRYDRDAIAAAAMREGSRPGVVDDVRAWLRSWFEGEDLEMEFFVDPSVTRAFVESHPDRIRSLPIEPSFTGVVGGFEVQRPVPGEYLDHRLVVRALEAALTPSHPPDAVEVAWGVEQTEISDLQLDAALATAQRLAVPLRVVVNDRPAVIGAGSVRAWIDGVVSGGTLVPVFVPERVEPSLERLLEPLTSEPGPPTFDVVDGEVTFELGTPAYRCCATDAGITELVHAAAASGGLETVELPVRLAEADGGLARIESLGIEEVVGEFTTRHRCCQSRVSNIHRIADLVRGQMLEPGDVFSINEFIGPRTREKGFVAAGTISQGHFVDDVGGGISQFATTMFNAAFFAGLDFDAYRSHTIYISRYPYGREATLSHPEPDLAVVNNTPYGLLIWTSYTGSSITVQFYSTKYWDTVQSGQRSFRLGACTRVNTFRTRTAPDGTTLEDMVIATYRPAEGIDCNGRAIPRP